MVESHSGTPDADVRSGSRPAPPDGRYLTDKKRLWASPTHTAVGRFFLRPASSRLRTAFISIACMRYRRGRPEQGVPLRAEGFRKRRCRFEFVAAERRI